MSVYGLRHTNCLR